MHCSIFKTLVFIAQANHVILNRSKHGTSKSQEMKFIYILFSISVRGISICVCKIVTTAQLVKALPKRIKYSNELSRK